MIPKVAVRKIENYHLDEIKEAVFDFLEGAKSQHLLTAKTVLIKPNLLGAFAPAKAVTTHPVVLEAVILYLLEKKKEIWLGDSPGGSANLGQVWKTTGMQELADKYPIRLVNFSVYGVREVPVNGYSLNISKIAWQADAIINVSKMKTHSLVGFTGAVKNLYGLIPGLIKTDYHKRFMNRIGFGGMIGNLHKAVYQRVAYNIMDGIIGMDGAGPSAGRARNFGLLLGSVSAPALDYLAAGFMGFSPQQVPYIKKILHDQGIIPSKIEYPLSFADFRLSGVNLATAGLVSHFMKFVPQKASKILDKLLNFTLQINRKCQSCLICVESCPVQTIVLNENGIPEIKNAKCIKCLCCHEVCPYQAIDIRKSLLAKLILREENHAT